MTITQLKNTICIDCSSGSFTLTDASTGTLNGAIVQEEIKIAIDGGDVVTHDLFADGVSLFNGTYTINANTASISSPGSVNSATISWTATSSITYSFYITIMVGGSPVSIPISYTSDSTATNAEIGAGLALVINSMPPSYNISTSYTGGSSLTITGGTNVYFGIASMSNVQAAVITPNPNNSGSFEDGLYTIQWILEDSDGIHTYLFSKFFLCNVECCVREKRANVTPGCGCADGKNGLAREASQALNGIKAAEACGKTEKAKALLEYLQGICNNECKSC